MDREQKTKKTWGERWKIGKYTRDDKQSEMASDIMIHPDYKQKYGTLSNGMLTKSMKYAETWLYSTVSVRGLPAQRPSLFLYPGVVAPAPRIVPQNSFRDSRNVVALPNTYLPVPTRSSTNLRKCGCSSEENCRKCVKYGTVRHKATLLNVTTQPKVQTTPGASDPYDMMRKSRLGVGEVTEKSILNPKNKKIIRGSSPLRNNDTSLSFETFRPDDKKRNGWNDWEEDPVNKQRKSILECPLNPYDINKKPSETFSTDEDLSDSTLEVKTKLKILRPKLIKTELNQVKSPQIESVRLNGQKFKIFDHSNSSTEVEDYSSDDVKENVQKTVENHVTSEKKKEEMNTTSSLIPRLITPQRPPRKVRSSSFIRSNLRNSRIKSKSSPNLSIKSILKKTFDDDETSSLTENVNVEPVGPKQPEVSPSIKTKKTSQNTLKKKKQVQFKVNNSNEDLNKKEDQTMTVEETKCTKDDEEETKKDLSLFERELLEKIAKRSKSMECLSNTGEKNSLLNTKEENTNCDHLPDVKTDMDEQNGSTSSLQRSYSDRRPSSAVVVCNNSLLAVSTSPPNSYLFNDTMALRVRSTRHDTRDIFIDEEGKVANIGKTRPREPPPPPPPLDSQQNNNVITYEEFSRRIDVVKPAPPDPPPRVLTTLNTSDSVKLEVKPRTSSPKLCRNCECNINNTSGKGCKEYDDVSGKTVVAVEPYKSDVNIVETNKTSIIINEDIYSETPVKTVIIKNSEDSNRITISLRNEEEVRPTTSAVSMASSTTTLIVGGEDRPKYLFSEIPSDVSIANMDPVEAVRRNLVPHVCGKEDKKPQTLMERIKITRDDQRKHISKLFTAENMQKVESLLTNTQGKKMTSWSVGRIEEESESSRTSRSNSFSTKTPSRSSSFNSNISKNKIYSDEIEKDKLEDEYEIRVGLVKDDKSDDEDFENIYETINEPIYDQIIKVEQEESDDDTPPPLPLTMPPTYDEIEQRTKSIFEGATKYDILSYLVDAKERGLVQEEYFSGSSTSDEDNARKLNSLDSSSLHYRTPSECMTEDLSLNNSDSGLSSRISHISHASDSSDETLILTGSDVKKTSAEIERNDSGVGSETSQSSRSKWQTNSIREDPIHLCEDCDQPVETQVTDSGVMFAPLVCRKCSKKRIERKEIIQEIVETEEKYGRDLKIILEEFYKPMLVAGLLTSDQLSAIFLNTEELLENSEQLTEKLRDNLDMAMDQGDEDLLTVNIGKLFLESSQMLHSFESYCTRQASSAVILANLEKEKELLRIFLRVSQMENTVLRRMNLNSFLMVPVQRVTKYPLLLSRLYKVTPSQHGSRDLLQEAQHNIELHLEHMNSEAKEISATKVWRRFSQSNGRRTNSELEMTNIKLRKLAIDVLEWNHEEVRFVLEGKLLFTQPTDNNWKRGRTIKLNTIFVLLVTLGKPNSKYKVDPLDNQLTFPTKTGIREATLLMIKEKCGRYTLVREPLYLDKIIVCCETDMEEYFEIQELSSKDTYIFKAEDQERTKEWYRQLQYHAQILGSWRRRRNALANIMINGMMTRTYAC